MHALVLNVGVRVTFKYSSDGCAHLTEGKQAQTKCSLM